MDIIEFPSNSQVDPLVEERMNQFFEIAKSSGMKSIAILGIDNSGDVHDCWVCNNDPYKLVGGIRFFEA